MDYAICSNNLAYMYQKTNKYPLARSFYLKALDIIRKNFGEHSIGYASTLDNTGFLFQSMRDYSTAEQYFTTAHRIYLDTLGPNHPEYATNIEFLASLYHERGEYDMAQKYHLEAQEIFRDTYGTNHPKYLYSLTRLFCLRYSEALHLGESISDSEDKMIDDVFAISNERQRLSFLKIAQFNLYSFLSLFVQHFSNSKEATQIVLDLVIRHKSIVLQSSASAQQILLGGKYPET